jgi:hypothetical protein
VPIAVWAVMFCLGREQESAWKVIGWQFEGEAGRVLG